MAAEDLPSEFDVVILGTGLAESVVGAACSRVGQKVLHLDRKSYYASNWASFTFNGLLTWIQQQQENPHPEEVQDLSGLLEDGEELINLNNSDSPSVTNLQVFCFASEEDEEEEEEEEVPKTAEQTGGGGEEGRQLECGDAVAVTKEEEEEIIEKVEEVGDIQDQTTGEEPEPLKQPELPKKKKKVSYAQLVKEGRRFNIDLVSKLMFSRGALVDLLIKSNVSRYAEFKNVTRILTFRNGKVEQVPCSRADVFGSRQLSMVEKRKLMRFLTSCMDDTEEQQAYSGRPYVEFLRDQQLGDNLVHFLLYTIAMATDDTSTESGLASTRHFLRCLGRYGNTPFLFPVYGLGEIPQCFCRMCAVFGGIYCLRHSVQSLVVDKNLNRCKAVIDSRGQRISCSHFIAEDSYVPAEKKPTTNTRSLSRAVLITDASVLPSDSEQQVSMVTVPPEEAGRPAVHMVELCSSTMTCMPGTYLVHLTCQSTGSAHEDLSPLVTQMFRTPESLDREAPSVLWCLYFNMADGSSVDVQGHDLPSNIYLCTGPDGALGHEHAIGQAEFIFKKILPDEEFCPPAPNPEDIIYDGENGSTTEEEGGEHKQEEEAECKQVEEVGECKEEKAEEGEHKQEEEESEQRMFPVEE